MGKLDDKDMDQLEQWIGTGTKTFTLLYSITRDGCNDQSFHSKCDNQGPTVTVLYNQQGFVYGGYASVSWTSKAGWAVDTAAFLYRLKFNGQTTYSKFDGIGRGHELYDHPSNGPTFGGNHDLHTFSNNIQSTTGYFNLNGGLNIGYSFNNNGIDTAQINNGNMIVTELEVYKVADGQIKPSVAQSASVATGPWRKTPAWDEKHLDRLIEDIVSFKGNPDVDIPEANILMIGPVGAGKSSFCNTVDSLLRGKIIQRAGCGSAEQSLTTIYKQYRVRSQGGSFLNFRLCDTRGLEENQGLDVLELNNLLEGHIPDLYQFNPTSPISPDNTGFIKYPSLADRIHCVAFVVDARLFIASIMDVLPAKIIQKIKNFQTMMNQRGIPQVVLFTKVDKLSTEVEDDITKVFSDETVRDAVEKASQVFGLPRANILPVKNYENEVELDEKISILAALSLRQILNFAEGHMENLADRIVTEKRGKKTASKE